MKRTKIILTGILLLFAGATVMAQGISFEEDLSWKQVLAKAKKENKHVFVDVMATWCVPCKEMEADVYPDSLLGVFANKNFISVKIQADKSPNDKRLVTKRYRDAEMILRSYGVRKYPTYLFFSPSGKYVHEASGRVNKGDFKKIMEQSLDTNTQLYGRYHRLITNYRLGRKQYDESIHLIKTAELLGNANLSREIAMDYISNFLLKLPDAELYTKDNLRFLQKYVSSKDKQLFKLFYPDGSKVDAIIPGISKSVLSAIVTNEQINANIVRDNDFRFPKVDQPDWDKIGIDIQKKYGVDGGVEINKAKRDWYEKSKPDANKLAEATIEYFEKFRPIAKMDSYMSISLGLNNALYDIAKVCKDRYLLLRAAKLQKEAIEKFIVLRKEANKRIEGTTWALEDTYACLLYQAGERESALIWMRKSLAQSPNDAELKNHMEQMNNGKNLILK